MAWLAPVPRSSGGRSAVSTSSGTRARSASSTAGWKLAAAVPEVHSTTTARPDRLAAPRAKNAADRSSRCTCTADPRMLRQGQRHRRRPRPRSQAGIGHPGPGQLVDQRQREPPPSPLTAHDPAPLTLGSAHDRPPRSIRPLHRVVEGTRTNPRTRPPVPGPPVGERSPAGARDAGRLSTAPPAPAGTGGAGARVHPDAGRVGAGGGTAGRAVGGGAGRPARAWRVGRRPGGVRGGGRAGGGGRGGGGVCGVLARGAAVPSAGAGTARPGAGAGADRGVAGDRRPRAAGGAAGRRRGAGPADRAGRGGGVPRRLAGRAAVRLAAGGGGGPARAARQHRRGAGVRAAAARDRGPGAALGPAGRAAAAGPAGGGGARPQVRRDRRGDGGRHRPDRAGRRRSPGPAMPSTWNDRPRRPRWSRSSWPPGWAGRRRA